MIRVSVIPKRKHRRALIETVYYIEQPQLGVHFMPFTHSVERWQV